MSFTGASLYQAQQIAGASDRIVAAELAIVQNLSTANARYAVLDTKDVQHDEYLSTLSGVKVDVSVYDAKMALLDTKDAEQDGRLQAVEDRATAIETDIAGRVESEIQSKVSELLFSTVTQELRDADSQLTSTLATKVATTVQWEYDQAQNSSIAGKVDFSDYSAYVALNDVAVASKVAQTAYDAYVFSNDAFVATRAAQTDLVNLSSQVGTRVGARVTLSQYNSEMSTFSSRVGQDFAAVNARVDTKLAINDFNSYNVTQSTINASKANAVDVLNYSTQTGTLIATKLTEATYVADKAVQDAVVASKVAQVDYDAYVALNNVAVNSKVSQASYDLSEASQNAAIALKAEQSAVDAYIASNNAAVASKVAQTQYDAYVASNDALVATKVPQVDYDAVVSTVTSYLDTYENRFNAVEEFVRAILATYSITLPDNTPYVYSGVNQGLNIPPPPFQLVGKRRAGNSTWLFALQFTDYGYNTMLGDLVFDLPLPLLNNGIQGFQKQNILQQTKYIEVPLPGTRQTGTSSWNTAFAFAFPIQYRNSQGIPITTVTFSQELFNSLPLLNDFTPETPTDVTYNATTRIVSFNVVHPYLVDFVDVNIAGMWFHIEDTSSRFSYVNNRVSVNMNGFSYASSGTMQVYTRYDKVLAGTPGANVSAAGFASLSI